MNAAEQPVAAPAASPFVDNGDGTVTIPALGLMFTKATLCEEEVNHATADKLCTDLDLAGHTDWRLPTVQELFALVDHSRHGPAVDPDAFPDTQSDWYWTSTPCAWDSSLAWVVYFLYGGVGSYHRDLDDAFVRAVRSVPAGQ